MEASMKSFSDEQLRAYFLGKLPVQEAESLEEKCAASKELTEQAQTVERELIDDYLRGNLSAPDASAFESNYPQTEARQHRLFAAKILWDVASAHKQSDALPAPVAAKPFWQSVFGGLNGYWLAFGSLVLLLIFGALIFYLPFSAVNRNDVAEIQDKNSPPKTENPVIQNTDNQTPENPKTVSTNPVVQNKEADKTQNTVQKNPAEPKTVPAPKTPKQNISGFAAFVLVSGTLRDEGEQSIKIAPNVKTVSLLLSPPAAAPNNYKIRRAVVKTADGDTLFTAANLKALSLKISADKLENRTYIVFLEGQNARGEFESISEYTFRVRR